MNLINLLHVFIIILFLVKLVNNASLKNYEKFSGDQGLYVEKDDVEILTVHNFKAAVLNSDRAWIVEFYNAWCGFCQRFAPSWKEFATSVKSWKDLVVVAAIDCSNEKNNALCRDYEIMSYPTLRYYPRNFQEEPKNYGFSMQRGNNAADHRKDLLKKLISEQREGKTKPGKNLPDLMAYTRNNIKSLFEEDSTLKFVLIIIQDANSTLGPQLILDFHQISNITVKYVYPNNSDVVAEFKLTVENLPNIFIIDKEGNVEKIAITNLDDNMNVNEKIQQELSLKGIIINKDFGLIDINNNLDGKTDIDVLSQIAKSMGDVVFQMDLESALRYSLKREVGGSKEITGEKLTALRNYLNVLVKYFPFGFYGHELLNEINKIVKDSAVVEGIKIGKLVKEAEKDDKNVFSTPQKWLGCRGSSPQYRGYPCGLWKMFHYLTVNYAENFPVEENPRLILEAMYGYIKNFFGCSDCSQHFQDMAARRDLNKVNGLNESILWLWKAHNEVNNRLSGDATEDPDYPKVQFPSEINCPNCYMKNGTWNEMVVLNYLKNMYKSSGIRYVGADTRIIRLDGPSLEAANHSSSSSPGGFFILDAIIYFILYIGIFVIIFLIIKIFLKRGYKKKMYRYKHEFLGKV